MEYFYGALLGILVYTLIATILIIILDEKEEVVVFLATGIFGIIISLVGKLIRRISKYIKRIRYRSIIVDKDTGESYYCGVEHYDNFFLYSTKFKRVKRYAKKDEWKDLPKVSQEMLDELYKQMSDLESYD